MRTFVIAEAGSTWDCKLENAYRCIDAAKACGADAVKFQWTSDPQKMANRRGFGADVSTMYAAYLQYPAQWLESMKAYADNVGIEFGVTTYLVEDIAVVAPLVDFFKISAFESGWFEFVDHHLPYNRRTIISYNEVGPPEWAYHKECVETLLTVSKYPCPISSAGLKRIEEMGHDGWSNHVMNVHVGGLAVACGASVVEVHFRLNETQKDNPDYPHSFQAPDTLRWFVNEIRVAEVAI